MQEWQNLPPPSSTIGKSINIDFFLFLLESKVVKYQWFVALFFSKVPVSRLRAQQYRIDWRRNPKQFFAKFAIFWIVLPCIAIQCITNNVVQCNIQSLAPLLYDIVQHWAIFLNIVHLHCTVHNGVLSIRRDKKTMMRRPTSLI